MKIFISILICLVSLPGFGQANESTGRLTGRVFDAINGAGISGVEIILFDQGQPKVSARSNRSGNFSFINVPAGTYDLVARKSGFENFNKSIRINPNFTLRFQFQLENGQEAKSEIASATSQPAIPAATQVVVPERNRSTQPLETNKPSSGNETVSSLPEPVTAAEISTVEIVKEEYAESSEADEIPDFVEFPDTPAAVEGGYPSLIKNITYPKKAIAFGIEGNVVVAVTVDQFGEAINCEIIRSVHPLLDEAAITTIYRTTFTPADQMGKKVISKVTIPVPFKLK